MTHPECFKGEVFLCNSANPEKETDFKIQRAGTRAYSRSGTLLKNMYPIFVTEVEMKKKIIGVYVWAAIIFELGGDWRQVFKEESKRPWGSIKQQQPFERWSTESDVNFNHSIDIFMGV